MTEHAWFARTVDLRAGESHGTGCLIRPRLVLTARHVMVDRAGRLLGPPRVRLLDAGKDLAAKVIWVSRRLDAGLVRVTDSGWQPPAQLSEPVRWGRVIGSEPVACRAMGFPWAQRRGADRHTEPLTGELHPGRAVKDGRIQVTVRSGVPRRPGATDPASAWAGIQTRPLPVDTLRQLIVSLPMQHQALAELGLSVSNMGQLADEGGEEAVRAVWKGLRGYWLCAAHRYGSSAALPGYAPP